MPLAWRALLPLAILLGTVALTHFLRARRAAGYVAAAGTAGAGLIEFAELLRLAPGARLDVPYLPAFPGADLAIRVDGLSLSFAVTLLATAAALMLARTRVTRHGDRREPWFEWLLTTTAALVVIMAANLLLEYMALQLLTLAWSGALDESSPRGRPVRLIHQIADLGLLLAAAGAIQSGGTSAFAGLPSDALGPLGFGLALLPAIARVGGLALGTARPLTPVFFEAVIAWAAPGVYLMLRVLSLTGGRPPGRPAQIVLFVLGLLAAASLCWLAARAQSWAQLAGRLLAVQAALAVALATVGGTFVAIAIAWLCLQLIPLSGLCALRQEDRSVGRLAATLSLTIVPPSLTFVGVWLGFEGLAQGRVLPAAIPLAILIVSTVLIAGSTLILRPQLRWNLPSAWGAALILAGMFPGPLVTALVLPAARSIRSVPDGTLGPSLLGLQAGTSFWPALGAGGIATAVLAFSMLSQASWLPNLPRRLPLISAQPLLTFAAPRQFPAVRRLPWAALGWALYIVLAAAAILR